mmetsp:Transcript_11070/g.18869  ORF Transcript_11070/g.18869 Transcript_11070/m.18869 type:complete len:211 (+) Transcript_11070:216-848(+)
MMAKLKSRLILMAFVIGPWPRQLLLVEIPARNKCQFKSPLMIIPRRHPGRSRRSAVVQGKLILIYQVQPTRVRTLYSQYSNSVLIKGFINLPSTMRMATGCAAAMVQAHLGSYMETKMCLRAKAATSAQFLRVTSESVKTRLRARRHQLRSTQLPCPQHSRQILQHPILQVLRQLSPRKIRRLQIQLPCPQRILQLSQPILLQISQRTLL